MSIPKTPTITAAAILATISLTGTAAHAQLPTDAGGAPAATSPCGTGQYVPVDKDGIPVDDLGCRPTGAQTPTPAPTDHDPGRGIDPGETPGQPAPAQTPAKPAPAETGGVTGDQKPTPANPATSTTPATPTESESPCPSATASPAPSAPQPSVTASPAPVAPATPTPGLGTSTPSWTPSATSPTTVPASPVTSKASPAPITATAPAIPAAAVPAVSTSAGTAAQHSATTPPGSTGSNTSAAASDPQADELAYTGFSSWKLLWAAGALVLAGVVIRLAAGRKKPRTK